MNGFWLIFRNEYRKKVVQRGFLLTTLGVPLMVILVMSLSILVAVDPTGSRAIGYVDLAEVIQPALRGGSEVNILAYPDVQLAQRALEADEIRAYYLLPADYRKTGQLDLYYLKRAPNETMRSAFDELLRASLLQAEPGAGSGEHLAKLPVVTVRSLDGSREIGPGGFINLILPFLASFGLIFAVMLTAGSLLQVVADEKENRTIEILVTSLTPEQLIGGKATALMAVCLTQITLWFLTAGVCLSVGSLFFEPLRQISVPWETLLLTGLFFLPAYALVAAIMTAIGGAVGEMRQGQQMGGLLNMVFLLPLFLSTLILQAPESPLVVFLTLFPTTAFATVLLRWSLGSVPLVQLRVSWGLLVSSALGMVFIAARVFRLGMLRYGKGLNWSAILSGFRSQG